MLECLKPLVLLISLISPKTVLGRFCEGGHRCSAPKECCAQGCCYLYAPPSPPKTPPPVTDHVLNLFFINHWYFWCVVLALVLALLCACSLWRKRRQLCGWSSSGGMTHSEGDSAGSCYAPPQYSRCSSFHHAPPPYTEVTSKPDLYPLVFSCNGDGMVGGKSGTGYLMVQYFRNYIVRPVGSLSATSTVESLSSSFICTINEANTIVPPPYSRAASPDANSLVHHHHQRASAQNSTGTIQPEYHISRSESMHQQTQSHHPINNRSNSVPMAVDKVVEMGGEDHQHQQQNINRCHVTDYDSNNVSITELQLNSIYNNDAGSVSNSENMLPFDSSGFDGDHPAMHKDGFRHSYNVGESVFAGSSAVSYSRSEYQLKKQRQPNAIAASNSYANQSTRSNKETIGHKQLSTDFEDIYLDSTEKSRNQLTRKANSSQSLLKAPQPRSFENHCKSMTVNIVSSELKADPFDSNVSGLNLTLDTHRCPVQNQEQQSSYMESPLNNKYDGLGYMNSSNTGSAVSSLMNMDSPGSPPQATSPTDEMRELFEQIRQLQHTNKTNNDSKRTSSLEEEHAAAAEAETVNSNEDNQQAQFIRKLKNNKPSTKRPLSFQNSSSSFLNNFLASTNSNNYSDGSSLAKPSRSFYIPVNSSNLQFSENKKIVSPGGGGGSGYRGKVFRQRPSKGIQSPTTKGGLFQSAANRKYGCLSRSAPTTPGSALPPNRFDDISPLLLDEHDEEDSMI